jgi:hypothetical protein
VRLIKKSKEMQARKEEYGTIEEGKVKRRKSKKKDINTYFPIFRGYKELVQCKGKDGIRFLEIQILGIVQFVKDDN